VLVKKKEWKMGGGKEGGEVGSAGKLGDMKEVERDMGTGVRDQEEE